MPPQAYNTHSGPALVAAAATAAVPSPATSSSDTKDKSQSHDDATQPKRNPDHGSRHTRSGRPNRILGDYTLSKTLGAGSMGKVKLATHNVTGEKVRGIFSFLFYSFLHAIFLTDYLLHSFFFFLVWLFLVRIACR